MVFQEKQSWTKKVQICSSYMSMLRVCWWGQVFAEQHPSSAKTITLDTVTPVVVGNDETQIVLQESCEKILFLVNRFTEPRGSLVTVTCVAPEASDVKFSYFITAKTENDSRVFLKTTAECTSNLIAFPPEKNCLLITKYFHRTNASKKCVLKASVKITKVSRSRTIGMW